MDLSMPACLSCVLFRAPGSPAPACPCTLGVLRGIGRPRLPPCFGGSGHFVPRVLWGSGATTASAFYRLAHLRHSFRENMQKRYFNSSPSLVTPYYSLLPALALELFLLLFLRFKSSFSNQQSKIKNPQSPIRASFVPRNEFLCIPPQQKGRTHATSWCRQVRPYMHTYFYNPAASRKAAALSVFSHGNATSSRPKCP